MAGSGTRNLNEQCQPNYRFEVIDTDYNPTMKTQMHRFLRVSLKSNFGHYSYSNYRKPRGFSSLCSVFNVLLPRLLANEAVETGTWNPWYLNLSIYLWKLGLPSPTKEEDFRKYYRPNYSFKSLSPGSHLMAKRISLEIFRTSSSIFLEECYSRRNITEEIPRLFL